MTSLLNIFFFRQLFSFNFSFFYISNLYCISPFKNLLENFFIFCYFYFIFFFSFVKGKEKFIHFFSSMCVCVGCVRKRRMGEGGGREAVAIEKREKHRSMAHDLLRVLAAKLFYTHPNCDIFKV